MRPTSSCSLDGSYANEFPLSIGYTSSDGGSGVERVELFVRIDSGSWSKAATLPETSGTYEFTPGSADAGYYEFYTKAFDRASNVETTSGADDGLRVDTTPPGSSASSPGSVTQVPFTVSFTSSDDGSGVANTALWYRYNGGAWTDTGVDRAGTAI